MLAIGGAIVIPRFFWCPPSRAFTKLPEHFVAEVLGKHIKRFKEDGGQAHGV
jgi:hypothetical protein